MLGNELLPISVRCPNTKVQRGENLKSIGFWRASIGQVFRGGKVIELGVNLWPEIGALKIEMRPWK